MANDQEASEEIFGDLDSYLDFWDSYDGEYEEYYFDGGVSYGEE